MCKDICKEIQLFNDISWHSSSRWHAAVVYKLQGTSAEKVKGMATRDGMYAFLGNSS